MFSNSSISWTMCLDDVSDEVVRGKTTIETYDLLLEHLAVVGGTQCCLNRVKLPWLYFVPR